MDSSAFATLWYKNTPQFSCRLLRCSQTALTDEEKYTCETISCKCLPGTSFCGGGGFIDLTSAVNTADGKTDLSCPLTNSTSCVLNFDFLSSVIPDGLGLNSCRFGECADKVDSPASFDTVSMSLDSYAVGGIAISGTVIALMAAFVVFGCIDLKRRRTLPLGKERAGAVISFEHIGYALGSRQILKDISGELAPGSILAIMGPSGAGKSTFLDIIARKRKRGTVSGNIKFGNEELGPHAFRSISGYVDQEDTLLSTLTVRESILFSALLRLPESMTTQQKSQRVDDVLEQLGLYHIRDSRIGDSHTRGISGGEKRRVSIGIELVTNPSVLFLDEPTSGLDSYNAAQVMDTLANLAHYNKKSIIFTIHQPRSDIFAVFDRVLLLSHGKSLFFGPASEASAYATAEGYPCPAGYNIADHLLDIASGVALAVRRMSMVRMDTTTIKERAKLTSPRDDESDDSDAEGDLEDGNSSTAMLNQDPPTSQAENKLTASFITQLSAVTWRSWIHFKRRPTLFLSHIGASAALGLFLGGLYYKVDNSFGGIQNRLGSIFFMQSLLGFAGLSSMTTFSSERTLFVRERSNGFYGPFPFTVAKLLFDIIPLRIIPTLVMCTTSYYLISYSLIFEAYLRFMAIMLIFSVNCSLFCLVIGCLIDDYSTATLVASISMLFQLLFAGILVNQLQIPVTLRWVQYLSLFKYAYEAAAANDAVGVRLITTVNGLPITISAATILTSFGIDVNGYSRDLSISFGISVMLIIVIATLVNWKIREKR